ncbi:MAG: hypothetical protein WC824_03365 [Bacteroidota bacterium]
MKIFGMIVIGVVLLFPTPSRAQGINLPQSLIVADDSIIYVPGNTLRPDGGSEIHVIAVDGSGRMQSAALSGSTHSLAADIDMLGSTIVVGTTEVRSETDHEMNVIGYDRSRLVGVSGPPVPEQITMSAIWPNPVTDGREAAVDIGIASECRVTLELFAAKGSVLARIMDTHLQPGMYTARFDTRTLPNGTYFCVFTAGGVKKIQKLSVVH